MVNNMITIKVNEFINLTCVRSWSRYNVSPKSMIMNMMKVIRSVNMVKVINMAKVNMIMKSLS